MYNQKFEVELNNKIVKLDCYFEIEPFIPGVYHLEPFDCYPDEGGYAELVDAKLDNNTFDITSIPKKEQYKICEEAYKNAIRRDYNYDECAHYRIY